MKSWNTFPPTLIVLHKKQIQSREYQAYFSHAACLFSYRCQSQISDHVVMEGRVHVLAVEESCIPHSCEA